MLDRESRDSMALFVLWIVVIGAVLAIAYFSSGH